MSDLPNHAPEATSGIKRIPKACGSCRQSKVRCDGQKPCARCENLKKECNYIERPKDATEDRFERLELEVMNLKDQVSRLQNHQTSPSCQHGLMRNGSARSAETAPHTASHQIAILPFTASPTAQTTVAVTSPVSSTNDQISRKRKRSQLQVRQEAAADFVVKGLITEEQARSCFAVFFQGCDRFVPVFDPGYDTFESVRVRSSILFNAIVHVGCSIQHDSNSQLPHMLNFELKKLLNLVVLSQEAHSLETVQALLITACYSPERSLLLSFATRVALDQELPDAFEQLTRRLLAFDTSPYAEQMSSDELSSLMRRSRTWFGLLVLENILHVDAGKLPTFAAKGGARRCRVLLQQPFSTALDLRLLSQVELNYLRARIHDTFQAYSGSNDGDLLGEVGDAKIDLDLWYNDWRSAIETSTIAGAERPSLLVNLTIQWHWSEAMAYFRALKCLGTENIDAMSPSGRALLQMARKALKNHLATAIDEHNQYLAGLRYAMDFVWAKCAFSFLLLLKLSSLLPDSNEDNYRLLQDGNTLLRSLTDAGTSTGSNTSRLYLQVLGLSLEKYGRALRQNQANAQPGSTMFFWEASDANNELQSFVPEQFVFEWDFPGLTLFSSPTAWQEFFDDFLLGFGGTEN
jgi:Fungal Zn(2)-Cys(6) binuclear cluster domain